MTEYSLPWDYLGSGDAGEYSDSDWQRVWRLLLGGVYHANAGVIPDSGIAGRIPLQVLADSPNSADVRITVGAALVKGIFYESNVIVEKTIASNSSGNDRIDTVILRADFTAKQIRIAVLEGTPDASPVPVTLTRSGTYWEIPLADVAVANGFSSISQNNITARASYIQASSNSMLLMQNNTGGDIEDGTIVDASSSDDRSMIKGTGEAKLGVALGRIAEADYGLIMTDGIAYINANAAVTRGQYLIPTTTAGVAAPSSIKGNYYGIALETTSGSGRVLSYIKPVQLGQYGYYASAASYSTTSSTFVDVDSTNLKHILQTSGRPIAVSFSAITQKTVSGTGFCLFNIALNDTTYFATAIIGERTTGETPIAFHVIIPASAGLNKVELQWRVEDGTGNILNKGLTFQAWEI